VATPSISQLLEAATQHHGAGRLPEAEKLYRQVLARQPRHPQALHWLGLLAHQAGHPAAAADLIGAAAAITPSDAECHNNHGIMLIAVGRPADAVAALRRAVALNPKFTLAYFNLGNALTTLGQSEEAIAAYQSAISLQPDHAEAHNNLGLMLMGQEKFEAAAAAFRCALAARPSYSDARSNLASALIALKDADGALAELQQVLATRPDFVQAQTNLAAAMSMLGRPEEAVAAARAALSLDPSHVPAWQNLARTLKDLGQLRESIEAYEKIIQLTPASATDHRDLALYMLLNGDFERGWDQSEWRTRVPETPNWLRDESRRWDGGDLTGKTIALLVEQGIGDTIQFVRYIPMLKSRGARRVILACPAELHRLLAGFDGIDALTDTKVAATDYDVDCPLLGLPRRFKTRLETIPASVPYLHAQPELADTWRRRLAESDGGGFRVGLVWAGNPKHPNDMNRSMNLSELAPLAAVRGVMFYSLQKGPATAQIAQAPADWQLVDLSQQLHDFTDTAAIVANLDLMICVDTSVAHLSGAMGKPTWVLLPKMPDWRWLLNRDDSPWYPTMRLFRQDRAGDWANVVQRVAGALAELQPKT
jgi:tetratricopeptide (TPR) repeat protein